MPRSAFFSVLAILSCCVETSFADTYTVTLAPSAREQPANGRLILFFITETGRGGWEHRDPIEGPFFEAPQPIASVEVKEFKPGESRTIDGQAIAFPQSLDKLHGKVRVQAILDADQTERSHTDGPGNVHSDVLEVQLSADRIDEIALTLTHVIQPPQSRVDQPTLKWIRYRSELLSTFYKRDVFHRAGVALPQGYNDPHHPRQLWPAIYVIPAYGGRDDGAEEYMHMLGSKGIEDIAPIGVYVVLDPESPLGHHGFVDSPANGPRGRALITELIPHLESQFKLAAKPEARLVTGHSSGGWSSMWLQLQYPHTFGGCWASSPDPIDFSAFQMTDMYSDQSVYLDAEGKETPSYRSFVDSSTDMKVLMTVRQECAMEHAIDPTGRSGQQWDAWEAMFSPLDPATGMPVKVFDQDTGDINKSIMRPWARCDLNQFITRYWDRAGPIVTDKVHLACGARDSFYLHRAVEKFQSNIESLNAQLPVPQGSGYVLLVEGADHETITPKIFQRWNKEMREHFQRHGLQDAD